MYLGTVKFNKITEQQMMDLNSESLIPNEPNNIFKVVRSYTCKACQDSEETYKRYIIYQEELTGHLKTKYHKKHMKDWRGCAIKNS